VKIFKKKQVERFKTSLEKMNATEKVNVGEKINVEEKKSDEVYIREVRVYDLKACHLRCKLQE